MEKKFYTHKSIGIGALIGGPLVGAYMMAHNFSILGQRQQAIWTWVISSIVLVGLFSVGFLLEGVHSIRVMPFVVGVAMSTISNKMQGEIIKEHLTQGGLLYSPWRVAVVTVIGIAMIVLPIFTYFMISDTYSSKSYTEQEHTVVYNSDKVLVSDADCFAEYLINVEYFGNDYQGFIAIDKVGDFYEISMPVTIEAKDNQDLYDLYADFLGDMRNSLPGKRIRLLLCLEGNLDKVIKRFE